MFASESARSPEKARLMKPRAVVFDAYGTLFDVHSAVLRDGHGITGDLRALSELWRQRQLEYTWLRSLMERYEDFQNVTEAALRSAVGQLRLQASEAQLGDLMRAYLFPSAFSDVKPGLESLKGIPLAILSNGTPAMLESAVRHNALESSFDEIISVDRVRTYKPSPRVYALSPSGGRDAICFLELVGCRRSKFFWLYGLQVQPIQC
jgi:2-haloacid dehalogenase